MKKINHCTALFCLICTLFITTSAYAAPKYPDKALGRPQCFEQSYSESYNWERIAASRQFGQHTNNPWIVYACNDGITAYEEPRSSSKVVESDIHFMEDFYVAALDGDYALLFYFDSSKWAENGLQIPRGISNRLSKYNDARRNNGYVGWVNIDDLLLWNITPKTKEGIFHKITIVKDVKTADNFTSMPQLFLDEDCTIEGTYPIYLNALDFYFALKQSVDGNVLVYNNYQLDKRMAGQKVGWVKAGEFINWNTRICWEPAFGLDINDMAYAFDKKETVNDLSKVVSRAKLSNERYNTQYEPRSPVIEYYPDDKIAFLSVLANKNGNAGDYIEIQKQIDALQKSLSNINIVFVMDATKSMERCFAAMTKAVQEIAEYSYTDNNNSHVRFGAVVYRNYADAPNNLVESLQLTDDFSRVETFLSGIKCFSASDKPQEAMFYGLNYAIDNMNWNKDQSNFIILISDVTSKSPDERGFTPTSVANKLVQNAINVVAFQARSKKEVPYVNFGSQICDIIEATLRGMGYPTKNNYNATTQIYYYYDKNDRTHFPIRPMGYKIKESDDQNINSSELTAMATKIIKDDFILTTQDNINRLRNSIGSNIMIDDAVCEYLIKKGVIRNCDELDGMLRIEGYTKRMWSLEKRMFVPCVFMADKELNDLIRDLEQVTRGTITNLRGELQAVFKRLILSYTGQQLTANDLVNFDDLIESIEEECGYTIDYKVKKHISNPHLLSDTDIDHLVRRLSNSIKTLQSKQNDSSTYKEQDGHKYYYILLEDMPLVTRQ